MFPLHSVLRGPRSRARAQGSPRAHRRRSTQHGLRLRIEALEDRRLLTAAPSLLADIAVGDSSSPRNFVDVNGVAFFAADDGTHGMELWKTDGTAAGTVLVKDIRPGSSGAGVGEPENLDGTLFFWADDGNDGDGLWKSDGTEEGTVFFKEFSSTPSNGQMTNVNGTLFFALSDNLWKSDGTIGGTILLKEFGSHISGMMETSGTLFFTAGSGSGVELWKSDGTEAGTVLVKDIRAGGNSDPSSLTNVGGTLLFNADDGIHGRELWKSDGTEQGTVLVKDIAADSASSGFQLDRPVNVNGTLFFAADDGTHGKELWKSDGTAEGTVRVRDINPGGGGAFPDNFNRFSNVNGTLFFWADNGADGFALWKSDGTEAGTLLVKDIFQGGEESQLPLFSGGFTSFDGAAFFSANDGTGGYELWKSDGTEQGTMMVRDIAPGIYSAQPTWHTVVNDQLLFAAADVPHANELWKSDGTAEGTVLVRDINPDASKPSNPHNFTAVGNLTFFVASQPVSGFPELWRTDGTEVGTFLVKDIFPGRFNGFPEFLTNVDGVLYFTAWDPAGWEPPTSKVATALWKSDGTVEGTVRVREIVPAEEAFDAPGVQSLVNVNGTLFFEVWREDRRRRQVWASDGTEAGTVVVSERGSSLTNVNGTAFFSTGELWTSDGTIEGTALVKDIRPSGSAVREIFPNINGTLFFSAFDETNGVELWKSDGTEQGTVLVKDINPGAGHSLLADATGSAVVAGDVLYFVANDGTHGFEVWKSDGTEDGTVLVKDIRPGASSSASQSTLFAVDGVLYFGANETASVDLWKSDGTEEGTVRVKDIPFGFDPERMTNVAGTLFFKNRGVWWRSDGSEDGTFPLADTNQQQSGLDDFFSAVVNDTFYFVVIDDTDRVLWMSDGTQAGTVPVAAAGTTLSGIDHLANLNGTLYFSADDGVHGIEPWIIAPEVVPALFYNAGGDDDAAQAGVPLAHDKLPYYAGAGTAGFENISSYVHGINGISVDLPPGHGPLTADDFTFKIGSGNDPQTWATGPTPTGISVLPGAGVAGMDRVQIVWPDGAIKNTWLQVMVKGNDAAGRFHTNTGLEASSIFYFGSLVGDAGHDASPVAFVTTAADQIEVRRHAGLATPTTARYDFDQSGLIDAGDELIARANIGFLRRLAIPPGAAEVVFPRDAGAVSAIAAGLAAPQTSHAPNVQTPAASLASSLRDAVARPATESPPALFVEAAPAPVLSPAGDPTSIDLALDDELLDSLLFEEAV